MKRKYYYVFRDSKTGRFITKAKAEKKNPATWERERRARNAG